MYGGGAEPQIMSRYTEACPWMAEWRLASEANSHPESGRLAVYDDSEVRGVLRGCPGLSLWPPEPAGLTTGGFDAPNS